MTEVREEARRHLEELGRWKGRPLAFMEVCGTHTMAAARSGLRQVMPPGLRLISGPGCPVCVTPVGFVDHALALAAMPGVTIATFGDLMRVPGSAREGVAPSLQRARASGADVRVVYSPLDALRIAVENPSREVVFPGVGFETTAPLIASAIREARDRGLANFSVLSAHKTIPEAMGVLASSDDLRLDGFLCPGHVSVILGPEVYEPVARDHRLPCVIAGFEPVEILRGLVALVRQAGAGEARVENAYGGAVRPGGNPRARAVLSEVFEPCAGAWRGLGTIPGSGLAIRAGFTPFDASRRFAVALPEPVEPEGCRCGDVLRGAIDPAECPLFGTGCTPENPVGACMVSTEGTCAARYRYGEEDE